MPPHFAHGAGMGTGSTAVVIVRHVEQSHLRLRIRSSGRTISSGGPRRSTTSRSFFMAQDVAQLAPIASPRGFPCAAKRATIAGMSWHTFQKTMLWARAAQHAADLAPVTISDAALSGAYQRPVLCGWRQHIG